MRGLVDMAAAAAGLLPTLTPPPPPFESFELEDRVRVRKNVNERFSFGELFRCDGDELMFIAGDFIDAFSFYRYKNSLLKYQIFLY
jgi:hypothetical protein